VDPGWSLPLQLVRPISPQFYYLPFLVAIWSAFRVFAGGSRRWAWLAGCATAFLLYTNFYLASFVVTGLGLLFALAFAQREAAVVRAFLTTAAVAEVGGLPYLYNLWLTLTHPNHQESFARVGGYLTRAPILPAVHVAVAVVFVALGWRARRERWYQFVVTFLAAGFVCLNQQLLTGRTVQPFHWESQTNKVLLEIALVVGAWHVARGAARPAAVVAARAM
jgi:hypothetical protein